MENSMGRRQKTPAASSRLVPRLLRYVGERGGSVDAIVRQLSLPTHAATAEEVALSPEEFETLMALAIRELGEPLLAVRLPELLDWPSYHIGELAARASPTIADAFRRVARYASLFYAHLEFAIEEHGDEFVVTHRLRSGGKGTRYSNEYALSSTLLNARRLSGIEMAPRRVFFSHREPLEIDLLRRHFGTDDIAFDRNESGIAFAAADAARASVGHDARLLATAEKLAEGALSAKPAGNSFVAEVTGKVRQALPRGTFGARDIAKKMRLSTRTFQRRLESEGTTFTELLERVRKDAATEAVGDSSIALGEAAARAGFADVAGFGRAFKRWTGRSPGVYRKNLPAAGQAARKGSR
jgi:AraC-like DNA-binding protein